MNFGPELDRIFAASYPLARGRGYIAGEAPASDDPDAPDGRFKILNVPSRGRIAVLERGAGRVITQTLSSPDGTWRIDGLNEEMQFTVMGFDDRGLQNAAIQDWIQPAVP